MSLAKSRKVKKDPQKPKPKPDPSKEK